MIITSFCYSQEEWKSEELEILNQFGLEKNDPRGIILYSGSECVDGEYSNIESAIETFLNSSLKKDISEYCVPGIKQEELIGIPLDIHQIVKLFLENN